MILSVSHRVLKKNTTLIPNQTDALGIQAIKNRCLYQKENNHISFPSKKLNLFIPSIAVQVHRNKKNIL